MKYGVCQTFARIARLGLNFDKQCMYCIMNKFISFSDRVRFYNKQMTSCEFWMFVDVKQVCKITWGDPYLSIVCRNQNWVLGN